MTERALPAGWTWTTLGDATIVSPRDPVLDSAAPFVTMSAVEVGVRYPVSYEQRGARAGIRARGNDVIFARITPCLENGKVALLPATAEPTGGSTEFIVIRPTPAVDPAFLYYWCLHPDVRNEARHQMAGVTGRMRLAGNDLAKFELPLPPLPEQHRIVEALEDHLSRVDAAEQSLSTAKQRLSPLRKSAIQIALDQELDGEEGHSAAERLERILADRVALASKRRAKPANPAYELDLPTGWVTASVDQLCWDIQYGTSSKTGELRDGSDVPVLRMGNIQDGDIDPRNLKYLPTDDPSIDGLLLEAGDLLFNRTNSAELVGKTAVFSDQLEQATFASYLIRCRPVPGVNAQWISRIANSPIGRRYITSVMSQQVGQANVNGTKLAAMPIPIAPQDVEARILDEISETRSSSARLGDSVEVAKARSAALRRSLLRAAFNGELVDQDPTDEPADVALAKIRDQQSGVAPRRRRKTVAAK